MTLAIFRYWPCRICKNPEEVQYKIMPHLVIIRCHKCKQADPNKLFPSIPAGDLV